MGNYKCGLCENMVDYMKTLPYNKYEGVQLEMEKLYTTEEVANYLGLTRRTIYTYIEQGKLRAKKVGREYRITQSSLDAFLNNESGSKD